MRAKNAVNLRVGVGIDTVLQNMDGMTRLLMATPGPKEGAYVGSVSGASQVRSVFWGIDRWKRSSLARRPLMQGYPF